MTTDVNAAAPDVSSRVNTSVTGPEDSTEYPHGVRATARIRATHNGHVTTLPLLRGDGPFHLRRIRTGGKGAKVGIIGAMSAPLGGDRLTLEIAAGDRSDLEVTTGAATLALRGPTPAPATYDVRLTVGVGATLRWLPQPLISAAGSNLRQNYVVDLAAGARLLLREEQLLGRFGEEPGHLVSRLRVRYAGRPLLDQCLACGDPEPGWDGPAVLGRNRAVGQILIVDPRMDVPRDPILLKGGVLKGDAVLVPLAGGPALLTTALASTSSGLRELLDAALVQAFRT